MAIWKLAQHKKLHLKKPRGLYISFTNKRHGAKNECTIPKNEWKEHYKQELKNTSDYIMCTRLKKEVVPYEEATDKWRYGNRLNTRGCI